MKRFLGFLVFALLIVGVGSSIESPLFAKVVQIEKIYSHEKGYKVSYYSAHGDVETCYVPIEWFYQSAGFKTDDGFTKAEIVMQHGKDYPYMEIFWKGDTFHHLRLFVNADYNARSWGVVGPTDNLDSKFDPTKPITFQF